MEAQIQHAWKQIADIVQPLPKTWPPKLVFSNTPTLESTPYVSSMNYLRPNEGPCQLDSQNQHNLHFLEIQTMIARNIELYQHVRAENATKFVEDLHSLADGFENIKRDRWEKGRRTYVFSRSYTRSFK
jgi:hypothetical protein